MKIKRKDLLEWVRAKTPVRYRGEIYRANYNGLRYYLSPLIDGDTIPFYHKGRGVFGLETNKL